MNWLNRLDMRSTLPLTSLSRSRRLLLFPALTVASLLLTAILSHAQTLYGVNFNQELLTIDPTTGVGSVVGSLGVTAFPVGIANRNGTLYIYDQQSDVVRPINTATGAAGAGISIGAGDLAAEGDLAFRNDGIGFLSIINASTNTINLYSFDITNNTSTLIATSTTLYDGLAFSPNGTLYAINDQTPGGTAPNLYTIDTTSGTPTLVGSLGALTGGFGVGALTFDSNGTLYATLSGTFAPAKLYTVNTTNGAATLVGNIGSNAVSGLAFLPTATPTAPEPGSLALLVPVVSVVGMVIRRRKK